MEELFEKLIAAGFIRTSTLAVSTARSDEPGSVMVDGITYDGHFDLNVYVAKDSRDEYGIRDHHHHRVEGGAVDELVAEILEIWEAV